MATNCASLDVDLFLFCYERDFVIFLTKIEKASEYEQEITQSHTAD